jgi:hypothetical protein
VLDDPSSEPALRLHVWIQIDDFLIQLVSEPRRAGLRAAIQSMERVFAASTVDERAALRTWLDNINPRTAATLAVPPVAHSDNNPRPAATLDVPTRVHSEGASPVSSSVTGPSNVVAVPPPQPPHQAVPPQQTPHQDVPPQQSRWRRLMQAIGSCRKKRGNEEQPGVAAGAVTEGGDREIGAVAAPAPAPAPAASSHFGASGNESVTSELVYDTTVHSRSIDADLGGRAAGEDAARPPGVPAGAVAEGGGDHEGDGRHAGADLAADAAAVATAEREAEREENEAKEEEKSSTCMEYSAGS